MPKHLLQLLLVCVMSWIGSSNTLGQPTRENADGGRLQVADRIAELDSDGNGTISRDEAPPPFRNSFDRLDTNEDGVLDEDELQRLNRFLQRQRAGRNRSEMDTQQLLDSAPDGVVIEPDLAYREGDHPAWRLDLLRPEKVTDLRRPAIVFIHGGGWRSGDKRRGYFIAGAKEYAQKGYVCITVNYRMLPKSNLTHCIEDVKCAVRWLRANADKYQIDPNRIGGYGNSAGAHLVAMLGLTDAKAGLEGDGPYQDYSSQLQAVCCSATPTDLTWFDRLSQPQSGAFSGDADAVKKQAKHASPISHVSKQAPPFLVVHGTGDSTVPIRHGDSFVEALRAAGAKTVEYIRIDRAGHGVFGQHAGKTHPAMEKFFETHLKHKP